MNSYKTIIKTSSRNNKNLFLKFVSTLLIITLSFFLFTERVSAQKSSPKNRAGIIAGIIAGIAVVAESIHLAIRYNKKKKSRLKKDKKIKEEKKEEEIKEEKVEEPVIVMAETTNVVSTVTEDTNKVIEIAQKEELQTQGLRTQPEIIEPKKEAEEEIPEEVIKIEPALTNLLAITNEETEKAAAAKIKKYLSITRRLDIDYYQVGLAYFKVGKLKKSKEFMFHAIAVKKDIDKARDFLKKKFYLTDKEIDRGKNKYLRGEDSEYD